MLGQSLKYFCLVFVLPCVHVHGQGQQQTGTCQRDSDCGLTLACIENSCSDPCLAITATPCPMKGGICKVTIIYHEQDQVDYRCDNFDSPF